MRAYKVVDAFSAVPLKGNPVAVILEAEDLRDEDMQAIANWTNLSETTFVLPTTQTGADYRLRIFTPRSELPFAGHPTLGSAHAILEAGLIQPRNGVVVQECAKGLVKIEIDGTGNDRTLRLELPDPQIEMVAPSDVDELEVILGSKLDRANPPAIVDVGAVWVIAPMEDARAVLALKPDFARSAEFEHRLGVTGITVFGAYEQSAPAEIEVRSFAPSCGVNEDPVCGSGNGSVAAYRMARDLRPTGLGYIASQGACVGRDGQVTVGFSADGTITIGGQCVTCMDGILHV